MSERQAPYLVARQDANQSEIVDALRKVGAVVVLIINVKCHFDAVVIYGGMVYLVEFKKIGGKLTPGEIEFARLCAAQDVELHIIHDIPEALQMIGGET